MLEGNYYKQYLRECAKGEASRVLFDYLIEPNQWDDKQFSLYYFILAFFSSNKDNREKIIKGTERYCQVHQLKSKIPNYLKELIEVSKLNKELYLDILNVINDGSDVKVFNLEEFVKNVLEEDKTFLPNPNEVYSNILKEFF
jgi:hypothetical protein